MGYKKLSNQPLKFVLAEFKFSPILHMSKFLPEIQEALRKKYPVFQKKIERIVKWANNTIETGDVERWGFVSTDKQHAVELDHERIIYFTSVYDRFEGFANNCKNVLKILSEIVEPSLIQRIGLRYSNLIILNDGEKMSDLVIPHFLCPAEISNLGSSGQQKTEILINTGVGKLAIRSLDGSHDLSHSPDLLGRLPIAIQLENSVNERLVLDFDHFYDSFDNAENFDEEFIMQKLGELHQIAREAFWCSTTEYARSRKWA